MATFPEKIKKIAKGLKDLPGGIWHVISYMILILLYTAVSLLRKLARRWKFFAKPKDFFLRLVGLLDRPQEGSISRIELIELAMHNMKAKSSRTFVTVGGMTVGIAAIVFLVSIGYGVQSLVINRAARLDEMRQMDVTVSPGSNLRLNDGAVKEFMDIPNVDRVLPQIAVVGEINFNDSSTDMAVYGVTRDYLEASAIAPVAGEPFENNDITTELEATESISTEVASDDVVVRDEYLTGEWVEVEGESDTEEQLQISKVELPVEIADREAVVNRAFLQVLDMNEAEALGETFNVSFVATGTSLPKELDRVESVPTEYKIIGVTPDDLAPLFYVPLVHLKTLGIVNYSQVKVVVDEEKHLGDARLEVESKGFITSSVVDTVEQINGLFATLRIILALVGTVALIVAALGMFNTLTVSLLERTREVGLLKAMGMKSYEVQDLFLAESMIMGSLGGVLGILMGLFVGKLLELLLSLVAIGSDTGWMAVSEIPVTFAVLIVVLSFLVGVITGVYPARRARNISALNALRYE